MRYPQSVISIGTCVLAVVLIYPGAAAADSEPSAPAAADASFAATPAGQGAPAPAELVERARATAAEVAVTEAFDRRVDRARDDLLLGNHVEAARKLESLAKESPDSARIRILQARAAMERGLGYRALRHLKGLDIDATAAPYQVRFLQAEAAQMAGQHKRAAALFAKVYAERPDTQLGHIARARRADALYSAGSFDKAEVAYRDILAKYPEYPRRHIAAYRRAQILLRQDKTREGTDLMQKVWLDFPYKEEGTKARLVLESAPLLGLSPRRISASALLERGRDLRRVKHWLVAERELQDLMTTVKTDRGNTSLENDIRVELALCRYDMQDWDEALERLLDLEERTQTSAQGAGLGRDFIQSLLQNTYQRMGNLDRAQELAVARLSRHKAPMRDRELADFYWDTGQYAKSKEHFDRGYKGAFKRGWRYAFLSMKAGHLAKAERLMSSVTRTREVPRYQSKYWLGRILDKRGKFEEALAVYEEVQTSWPLTYYGYQSANRISDMRDRGVLDMPVSARQDKEGVAALAAVPAAPVPMAQWATPERGLPVSSAPAVPTQSIAAPVGALPVSSAPPTVASVHPVAEGDRAARIYWLGPDQEPSPRGGAGYGPHPESHDDEGRMEAYADGDQLVGDARAAARLHGDLFPGLREVSFLFDIGLLRQSQLALRDVTLEYRGLDYYFSRGRRPTSDRPIQLSARQWEHYIDHRGSSTRGFWGMSRGSLRYDVPRLASQKRAMAERQTAVYERRDAVGADLGDAMKEVGDFHFVRKERLGRGGWWRVDPAGDAREMWSEAYPRAFPEWVQRYAAKEKLNPYLLWALMTVESAYNPDSVSYADARGLLQVIPKTGNKVAADIGDNEFGQYDLLDPETSIRHGAWYFAHLVRKFEGQEPLAIASYNGGPHNVSRWLVHKHDEPLDEFVEEIPFDQARRYTKKVLRFLALFLRIYEGADGIYVGQNLHGDVLADPRY